MHIVIAYLTTLAIFAVIDTLWLGYMGDRFYRPHIGEVLADQFRLGPAVVFYAVYAAGLTLFAVTPGLKEGWKTALLWGGLFGFFAYATYDLTNHATLKSWSLTITVADIAWGVFVSATTAALACLLSGRIMRLIA